MILKALEKTREMRNQNAGEGERKEARPSPDGAWILYMGGPDTGQRTDARLGRVMRIARTGTSPELVLQVAGYPRPPKLAWAGQSLARCSTLIRGFAVLPCKGLRAC